MPVRQLVPSEHAHGLPEQLPEKNKTKPHQAWRKHGILDNAFRIGSPNGGETAVCLSEDVLAHPSVCNSADCTLDCCNNLKNPPADQLRRYSFACGQPCTTPPVEKLAPTASSRAASS